jgi:hypothetical protein
MQQERREEMAMKEAKSRAVVLEMLGDLPDVEARAPENVRGIRGADEGCNVAWREREWGWGMTDSCLNRDWMKQVYFLLSFTILSSYV